ncbi:MAG: hypothetical protein R6V56_02820 [Lentisphaeria bacterium]
MLKIHRNVKLLLLIFLLMFLGWGAAWLYIGARQDTREDVIAHREVVTVAYMALYSLREKGPNTMAIGIEGTLDHGVIGLWENRNVLREDEYASAMELLRKVMAYRERYPRVRSSCPELANVQAESDQILSGL